MGLCAGVQLEECICNLQHEDVRVVVLVADKYAFTCPSHAMFLVMLFETLQPRKNRRILFWLSIFCAECVVAERI